MEVLPSLFSFFDEGSAISFHTLYTGVIEECNPSWRLHQWKNSLTAFSYALDLNAPWDKTSRATIWPGKAGRSSLLVGPSQSPLPQRDMLWGWKSLIVVTFKEDRAVGGAVSSWDSVTSTAGTNAGERGKEQLAQKRSQWYLGQICRETCVSPWRGLCGWWGWKEALRGLPVPSAECTAAARAGRESPHGFSLCFLNERLKSVSHPIRRN